MKTSYFIIIFIVGIALVFSYLLNFTISDDHLELEIESLKKDNINVIKFYDTFETISIVPHHYDNYDATTGEGEGGKWRIGFDSQHDGQIHLLEVYYFAWMPFGITYKCFDSDEKILKIYTDNQVSKNIKIDC